MAKVDWELYKRLLDGNLSLQNIASNDAVNSFLNGIVDDPAYQPDAKVNGVITPFAASRKSTTECSIKAAPGTKIHIGDVVECLGEKWLVVELYTDKVGLMSGVMWLCNECINFQNNSATVYTRCCIVDDGTYSKRSSDPNAFVMANTYKIYLSIDDATKRIYIDKRLALGSIYSSDGEEILEVYKIIGIDAKTRNFGAGSHLMVLTVQRDVYNPHTDNLANNICDFYAENTSMSTVSVAGSCMITGKNYVRIGTSREYRASFTDVLGNAVSDVVTLWRVDAPNGIEHAINGNVCTITVPLLEDLIGSEIVLKLENGEFGEYETKVQVIAIG